MLIKILIAVAVVIVLVVIIVATRPGGFRIARSITIAAPPEVPFAQVNDFHAWTGWSPWENRDPEMTRTYGGPTSGVGSTYAWAGKKVGEGRMTIEKSDLAEQIEIKLEFLKPFAATNKATFTFEPTPEGGTKVNWAMDGCRGFMGKLFSMLMNMDKLIGGDFEKGLAAMKSISESQSAAAR